MQYEVKFGDNFVPVENAKELPGIAEQSQSFGWLTFTKEGVDYLARPGGWRANAE